jgi:hypothetical protein
MIKNIVLLALVLVIIQLIQSREAQIQEFRKCAKNLCQNNGVCWLTDQDYVVCSCPYPYYGSLCQLTRDNNNNTLSLQSVSKLYLRRSRSLLNKLLSTI